MLKAKINNFISIGELIPDGKGGKYGGLIKTEIRGHPIEIRVDREFVVGCQDSDHLGKDIPTALLLAPSADKSDRERWELDMTMLCEMLSFSTNCRINVTAIQWDDDPVTRLQTGGNINGFNHPFINGFSISNFVTRCFSSYATLRDSRQLNVVVDYLYHASMPGAAIELQLAAAFILMENLKHTWATNHGYPKFGNNYHQIGSVATNKGPRLTFKNLLDDMFSAVGAGPTPQDFIDLRNELIHSGLLNLSVTDKTDLRKRIITNQRDYLLRLLGYTGKFYGFGTGLKSIP